MARTRTQYAEDYLASPAGQANNPFGYWVTNIAGQPDRPDFAAFQQDIATLKAERETQRVEDEAVLAAQTERRATLRRRRGPTGAGSTILTSPLGVAAPFQAQPKTLLGLA